MKSQFWEYAVFVLTFANKEDCERKMIEMKTTQMKNLMMMMKNVGKSYKNKVFRVE